MRCELRLPLRAAASCVCCRACSLAPDYKVPETPRLPPSRKPDPGPQGTPQDALPREAWWPLYGDATLNGLEDRIESANPTLAQAMARYDAAQGYLAEAQSGHSPDPDGRRPCRHRQAIRQPAAAQRQPADLLWRRSGGRALSWDLDLWGRIRNEVAAGKAEAQSSFADLQAIRLSLQAQLADDYLQLRGLDAQAQLLHDTIGIYHKALDLTNARHDKGHRLRPGCRAARRPNSPMPQARIVGCAGAARAAGTCHRQPGGRAALPISPSPVPRSHFKSAECAGRRAVHSAAAPPRCRRRRAPGRRHQCRHRRGARRFLSRYFACSALAGFQNTGNDALFTAPDAFWALGPSMALTLFDAGRHEGQLAVAKAANSQAAAAYRAAVLRAFQDVEDNLALAEPPGGGGRCRSAVGDRRNPHPGPGPGALPEWRLGFPGCGGGPDHGPPGPAGGPFHPDPPACRPASS